MAISELLLPGVEHLGRWQVPRMFHGKDLDIHDGLLLLAAVLGNCVLHISWISAMSMRTVRLVSARGGGIQKVQLQEVEGWQAEVLVLAPHVQHHQTGRRHRPCCRELLRQPVHEVPHRPVRSRVKVSEPHGDVELREQGPGRAEQDLLRAVPRCALHLDCQGHRCGSSRGLLLGAVAMLRGVAVNQGQLQVWPHGTPRLTQLQ
mmetsp:Transcript_75087/g.220019  ORF Transcript_75087/g.220019 Transcript_75087/m.220019 type:complete len:204 (-) Transcript_75087:218-829(-)